MQKYSNSGLIVISGGWKIKICWKCHVIGGMWWNFQFPYSLESDIMGQTEKVYSELKWKAIPSVQFTFQFSLKRPFYHHNCRFYSFFLCQWMNKMRKKRRTLFEPFGFFFFLFLMVTFINYLFLHLLKSYGLESSLTAYTHSVAYNIKSHLFFYDNFIHKM